jgi:hypothetical protein
MTISSYGGNRRARRINSSTESSWCCSLLSAGCVDASQVYDGLRLGMRQGRHFVGAPRRWIRGPCAVDPRGSRGGFVGVNPRSTGRVVSTTLAQPPTDDCSSTSTARFEGVDEQRFQSGALTQILIPKQLPIADVQRQRSGADQLYAGDVGRDTTRVTGQQRTAGDGSVRADEEVGKHGLACAASSSVGGMGVSGQE